MSRPTSSPQTALARSIAVDIRAIYRKLKLRAREHGADSHLNLSQTSVLRRLETDGPATVSSLARAEGMRPQSMSAIVAPLQERGFVRGVADPGDGRQTLMSLTPKCIKWIEDGRAARQDWLSTTISTRLSAREQQQLRAGLDLLTRVVED